MAGLRGDPLSKEKVNFEYDIIVVGGGHAGCEAAVAAARLGSRTLLITMDISKVAAMSCNPAVGGVAKGQIVREIDALGGQMGIITDKTAIQFRMLNRSKGAAMWSPRAQCDMVRFSAEWLRTLGNTENLFMWQDSVIEVLVEKIAAGNNRLETLSETGLLPASGSELGSAPQPEPNSGLWPESGSESQSDSGFDADLGADEFMVTGVKTQLGVEFKAGAVILTNGTFLNGLMHVGRSSAEGGRAGDQASAGLTENLATLGFTVGRMKTGTPARIDARTVDFSKFQLQPGDENPSKFSFMPDTQPLKEQLPCYLVHTSEKVHEILRSGFADSPLFNGTIQGVGPRYCPSIEDKLRTFADKISHQLFLEPEGADTNEYYLNGFSSSLPLDVQVRALQQIEGFENIHIYRPGYAVEYDYFPPTQLKHSLETKIVDNLYFAGQINGTTGYEEAAAQGLMAGINARRKLAGCEPVILSRDQAYIGVLIDDLVTKGVDEPYRMFTSRAEYRILLRQDNADLRLTPVGMEIGLVTAERAAVFERKKTATESLVDFLRRRSVVPAEIESYLKSVDTAPITQGRKLYDILLRNEVSLDGLIDVLPDLRDFVEKHDIGSEVIEEAEIQIKYNGYIQRERFVAEKLRKLENIRIPTAFDFNSLQSLTIEARQKLSKVRPATIGQASRIPGVSPADINVLLIYFGR